MKIKFNENEMEMVNAVLPAGKYRIQLKNFVRTTAKTGMPQIRCDFEVLDNPEYEGLEKREYFPLDRNSLWRLKQFISSVVDVSKLGDREIDVSTMWLNKILEAAIGRSLYVYYGVDMFEGLNYNYSRRYEKMKEEELALPPEDKNSKDDA